MKRYLVYLTLFATVVFSMTSCLKVDEEDEDDYVELTAAQKSQQIAAVQGSYTGKIYGFNPYLNTIDSLECTMFANDTILTLNVSKKMFTSIATSTTNKLITEENSWIQSKHVLRPYYNETEGRYSFSIYPTNESLNFDININEKASHMTVYYSAYYQYSAYNYLYPVSVYDTTQKRFGGYIPIYGVSVEGGTSSATTYLFFDMYKD